MRFFYIILFFLPPFYIQAEDLNVIWKGILTQGQGGCYPQYSLELQINFFNNQISGRVYDYYDTGRYVKLSFSGRYNPKTHRMVLIENKVLQFNIPADCVPCIKTYDLIYSKNGDEELLSGDRFVAGRYKRI